MSERIYRILVINPGSTSTKVSVFENETCVFERSVFHEAAELLAFAHVNDQLEFRRRVLEAQLTAAGYSLASMDVFVGRGGSAHTQRGGITQIDERLWADTVAGVGGSEHPAKLGVMLAWQLAQQFGCTAYTLDPTNVDEFSEVARLSGLRGVYRRSHAHVLNQKAVATLHAAKLGKDYEACRFIVAHIDGGITVSAHENGRMIDGNMGADGEGAFSPTRLGSVPVLGLLAYLKTHTLEEVRLKCTRAGGFVEYFGTSDADKVHARVEAGEPKAKLVWEAMIYQISKMIGAMGAVLCGQVEAILLTGGLVRFQDLVAEITRRCGFLAPVSVYPGEHEQEALAFQTLRALRGEVTAQRYTGRDVWTGFSWETGGEG